VFGLLGVFARYFTNSFVANTMNLGFPIATLAINILGSFLIGFTYVASSNTIAISEDLRIALLAGLLGGFTTFSAFSLDTVSLFTAGQIMFGGLYVIGSVAGGIGATVLGLYIGKHALGLL